MGQRKPTSSSDFTKSWCLFTICFSTKDGALNNFEQVLHLYFPSSSCLTCGSTAFVSSLEEKNVKQSGGTKENKMIITLHIASRHNPVHRYHLYQSTKQVCCRATQANAHLKTKLIKSASDQVTKSYFSYRFVSNPSILYPLTSYLFCPFPFQRH